MTLTQIQAAVDELPLTQKQVLLQFLRQKLQKAPSSEPAPNSQSQQEWLERLRQTAKTLNTGVVGDDFQTILDELRADR